MNNNAALREVCSKAVKHCDNTKNLVKHLKTTQTTERGEIMVKWREEGQVLLPPVLEFFGAHRHDPGTEGGSLWLVCVLRDICGCFWLELVKVSKAG